METPSKNSSHSVSGIEAKTGAADDNQPSFSADSPSRGGRSGLNDSEKKNSEGDSPSLQFREIAAHAAASRPRIFFDASLTLHYGLSNPVGIVRAEHYVAEFLMRDETISLDFVTFDRELRSYRALNANERRLIRTILFHRYKTNPDQAHDEETIEPSTTAVDLGVEQPLQIKASRQQSETTRSVIGSSRPLSDTAFSNADASSDVRSFRPVVRARIGVARRRFRSALTLPPAEFNSILTRDAARLMPVKSEYSPWRRLSTRVTRRLMLLMARRSHAILYAAAKAASGPFRPDLALSGASSSATIAMPTSVEQALGQAEAMTPLPLTGMAFRKGDVLISMANTWDYMDYGYLHGICAIEGVRFVAVLYDVIAMMHPFTTPGPPHIYQRHWVEIGHDASHIVAISRHSVDTYTRYICQPNDLAPPLSFAYLPNFLKARSTEIGEKAVDSLTNHPFVFFCSTIETRKNHQVLLHAWDRLRDELGVDSLPTLVFVGKWGWGTETVRMLVERNWRLRKRVRVLDSISDAELIWMYKNARFTVFPALSEGFGLAVAESLSFGTPVVVSNCPALQEAAENLMPSIDPFDLPAWVDVLRSLIVDDHRLEALRKTARQYRGPDYNQFGAAMRDAALSAAQLPNHENV